MHPSASSHPVRYALVTLLLCFLSTIPITYIIYSRREAMLRRTGTELSRFQGYVAAYTLEKNEIPGYTVQDCVSRLIREPWYAARLRSNCPMLLRNRDAWGHAFLLRRNENGQGVVIYSTGQNGRDEGGRGDDLAREITLPTVRGPASRAVLPDAHRESRRRRRNGLPPDGNNG